MRLVFFTKFNMRKVTQEELQKTHSLVDDIKNGNSSYYALLGVETTAPESEITKAYRTMALKFHPDKSVSLSQGLPEKEQEKITAQATEITTMLTNAYSVLMDEVQRKQYDLKLSVQGQGAQSTEQWTQEKSQDVLSIIRSRDSNDNVLSQILNQQNVPKNVLAAISEKIRGEETLLKLLEYQSDFLKFRDPGITKAINDNIAISALVLAKVAEKTTNPNALSILNSLDKCDDAVRLAIAKNHKCGSELAKTLISGGIKDTKLVSEAAQNLARHDNAAVRKLAIQTLESPSKTHLGPPGRQSARSRVPPSQKPQDTHKDEQPLSKNPEISLLQVIDRMVSKIENDSSLSTLKQNILAAKDATKLSDILLSEQKSANAVDPSSLSSAHIAECLKILESGFSETSFVKVSNDKSGNDEVKIVMAQQALYTIEKLNKAFPFFLKPPAADLGLARDLKDILKNQPDSEKVSKINECIGKYVDNEKPSKEIIKILKSCDFSVTPTAHKPSDESVKEMSPSKPGAAH